MHIKNRLRFQAAAPTANASHLGFPEPHYPFFLAIFYSRNPFFSTNKHGYFEKHGTALHSNINNSDNTEVVELRLYRPN